MAAMRGQLYLLRQMEPRGATLDARDHKDRRPLEVAEDNRQGAVAQLSQIRHVSSSDQGKSFAMFFMKNGTIIVD